MLRDVIVLAGAGVGGGSLNYANTLYQRLPGVLPDPQWADITDWRSGTRPVLRRPPGCSAWSLNPATPPATGSMRDVAIIRPGEDLHPTQVGVFFGRDGEVGTRRRGTGSVLRRGRPGPSRLHRVRRLHDRLSARREEHIDRNYLALAESAGAVVHPETTVLGVAPRAADGGWDVVTRPPRCRGLRASFITYCSVHRRCAAAELDEPITGLPVPAALRRGSRPLREEHPALRLVGAGHEAACPSCQTGSSSTMVPALLLAESYC